MKLKLLVLAVHFLLRAAAGGHTVTLTWTLPPDMVAGDSINVMRGTAPGAETQLTNLKADATTGAFPVTYVYSSFTEGVTYYYVVTHMRGADGKVSVPSNEVAATIPMDVPSPPTTLVVK
jgi:hypothetical protein